MWRETTVKEKAAAILAISIHSLRVEGDAVKDGVYTFVTQFQSTPSVWRETRELQGVPGI